MTAQQEPNCIHRALCYSAQNQNASGCIGRENCRFYASEQDCCPFIAWDIDPEIGGEYRCEIGGKTSSEKCECLERFKGCIRSSGPIRSPTAKEYIITESQIDKFLDYVEDDTNHDESKYKNARGLAYKIRIRALPHNPEPHPTPLCNSRCKLYLVGRGCIHQLEYESTGICRESIRAETRAATIAEVLASAGSKCPDTCIYKRNAEEHDDQVREKVLDELIRRIDTATEPDGSIGELFHLSGLHCIIDSLRPGVKKP